MVVWTVIAITYIQAFLAIYGVEQVSTTMSIAPLSIVQKMLAALGFLTTCPLLATLLVNKRRQHAPQWKIDTFNGLLGNASSHQHVVSYI